MSEEYLSKSGLVYYDGKIKDYIKYNLAAPFSTSATYAVNDVVLYNNKTWRCKVAVSTAGSWTGSTNWEECKLGDAGAAGLKANTFINGPRPANYVLAGPTSGSSAAPTFRALTANDIPSLSYVPLSTVTAAGDLIVGSGNATVTKLAKGTAGQLLAVNSGATGLEWKTVSIPTVNDKTITVAGASGQTSQTFTLNQSTDKTITVDKTFVGLGSVENYGQESNPTENSSKYFTAGGAYSLKTQLETMIRTQAAHFRGSWATWADVPTTAASYPADSDGNKTPTANDYMIVEDATGYGSTYTGTWRFIYTGTWSEGATGKNNWEPAYKIENPSLTFKTIDSTKTTAQSTSSSESITGNGTINLHKIAKTGTYSDLISRPTFTVNSGSATTISAMVFKNGSNVSITQSGQEITIASTNTNYYPTEFTWANGTTAGPTATITMSGTSNISVGAIPSASASISGIVTTGAQTFAGAKTFNTDITVIGNVNITHSGAVPGEGLKINTAGGFTRYTDMAITIDDTKIFNLPYSKADGTYTLATMADIPTVPTGFTITANATDGMFDITGTSGTNAVTYAVAPYSAHQTTAGRFDSSSTNPAGTTRLNYNGYLYATKLYSGGSEVLTSHQTIPVTDVQINGTSIVSSKIANFVTNQTYNASTNKIATMSDIPSITLSSSAITGGTQVQWGKDSTTVTGSLAQTTTTGNDPVTTTTWILGSTTVAFASISKAEIDALF